MNMQNRINNIFAQFKTNELYILDEYYMIGPAKLLVDKLKEIISGAESYLEYDKTHDYDENEHQFNKKFIEKSKMLLEEIKNKNPQDILYVEVNENREYWQLLDEKETLKKIKEVYEENFEIQEELDNEME